jgi:hypothetical protein
MSTDTPATHSRFWNLQGITSKTLIESVVCGFICTTLGQEEMLHTSGSEDDALMSSCMSQDFTGWSRLYASQLRPHPNTLSSSTKYSSQTVIEPSKLFVRNAND